DLCYAVACGTVDANSSRPTINDLTLCFEENLLAQGTTIQAFFDKSNAVVGDHQFALFASEDGFLRIDLEALRRILVSNQDALVTETNRFPDPAGVILKKSHGEYVTKDEEIATVRTTSFHWPAIQDDL